MRYIIQNGNIAAFYHGIQDRDNGEYAVFNPFKMDAIIYQTKEEAQAKCDELKKKSRWYIWCDDCKNSGDIHPLAINQINRIQSKYCIPTI